MKILVLNGPNINRLSNRNTEHYGSMDLDKINELITSRFSTHSFKFFQSNIEGELVSQIHNSDDNYEGLIINPGGYAHTSVSIKDALEICSIPKVEVHLSNLAAREDFRQTLLTASSCDGYISGFKENSYIAAVHILEQIALKKQ
jgi:3-dehydroquinate dehydratase-2